MTMEPFTERPSGMNLFAAILNALLKRHGGDIGKLDNRGGDPIHPQKVQRLLRSLRALKTFPVLNKRELEAAKQAFSLDFAEMRYLRAAIMATGIEAKLAERIAQTEALEAAWRLMPLLEQALADAEDDDNNPISKIRKYTPQEGGNMPEDTEFERRFALALQSIERASLLVEQLDEVSDQWARRDDLQQAAAHFERARQELQQADAAMQATEAWKYWSQQVDEGLAAVKAMQ